LTGTMVNPRYRLHRQRGHHRLALKRPLLLLPRRRSVPEGSSVYGIITRLFLFYASTVHCSHQPFSIACLPSVIRMLIHHPSTPFALPFTTVRRRQPCFRASEFLYRPFHSSIPRSSSPTLISETYDVTLPLLSRLVRQLIFLLGWAPSLFLAEYMESFPLFTYACIYLSPSSPPPYPIASENPLAVD